MDVFPAIAAVPSSSDANDPCAAHSPHRPASPCCSSHAPCCCSPSPAIQEHLQQTIAAGTCSRGCRSKRRNGGVAAGDERGGNGAFDQQARWIRRPKTRKPSRSFALSYSLIFCISWFCCSAFAATTVKNNEIDVDWTMAKMAAPETGETISPSAAGRPLVRTKYVRLKDVLRFRCPPALQLAVHLVPAESALLCQLPPEPSERDRSLIGFCGPNLSAPRLILRRYSPLPGRKASFQEGQSYFFISTSDGTPSGMAQASGGLCRSSGLRLRIMILPSAMEGAHQSRPADEMTDLAQLLFPAPAAPNQLQPTTLSTTSTTIAPPIDSHPLMGVFPAILTLEEQSGQQRKVWVKSERELNEQIELANAVGWRGNGQDGLTVADSGDNRGKQRQHFQQRQDAHYEITGDNKLRPRPHPQPALSPLSSRPSHHRHADSQQADDEQRRSLAKLPRSPDPGPEPLVESQRLVFVIGYDGHEPAGAQQSGWSSSGNGNASCRTANSVSRILLLVICITVTMARYSLS